MLTAFGELTLQPALALSARRDATEGEVEEAVPVGLEGAGSGACRCCCRCLYWRPWQQWLRSRYRAGGWSS